MIVALCLLFAIVVLLFYLDSMKPKNYPPGPRWLPFFGNALIVSRLRKQTGALHLVTNVLSKRYGPLIGLKIGRERIVVAYGGEAIREFLSNEDLNGRPRGPFYEIRTLGRNGVMLTDTEFWSDQRRFILRHLREFGFGRRNMSELIEQEARVMVEHLRGKLDKCKEDIILQMDTIFGIHILNTLWTMIAGTKYSPDDEKLRYLQTILNKLLANIDMTGALFSHFPILRFLAPEYSGYSLYVRTHVPLWNFIREEIARHKVTYEEDNIRDLIDVYIQMMRSEQCPISFTDEQLLAVCLDLFEAGSETTSKSLGFSFTYLLLNPNVQKKAQEEIDMIIGRNRLPTLSDRAKMPYMEGVVLESIRMFMGRTLGVPHRALTDTKLCGYSIPKDTMVIPNFNGVLKGAEFMWDDPEIFRPERYIKDGHIITLPENFLPFGFGKRRCLGETLAKANLFIFITALLQNFSFEVPKGHDPPSKHCVDGVTPGPVPFKGLVTFRI